jgi:hypothetical protein
MPARLLEYHQSIFDLLGVTGVVSEDRLAIIWERESQCGTVFPASVREWFAIEGAESIFYDNSNQDHLTKLQDLGVPVETSQGYLRVATENQAVVGWYVRLNEGENPPVYDNSNEWNDDLSRTNWYTNANTFSNFIFDVISTHHFGGRYTGMQLFAVDRLPGDEDLDLLREHFQCGPITDQPDWKVYRFFTTRGVITIKSRSSTEAEWTIDADSPESVFQFGQKVWRLGTLDKTLQASSSGRREEGEKVLMRLRGIS